MSQILPGLICHCLYKPKGGTLLLYDLGPDETQWESNKKKLRLVYVHACVMYVLQSLELLSQQSNQYITAKKSIQYS